MINTLKSSSHTAPTFSLSCMCIPSCREHLNRTCFQVSSSSPHAHAGSGSNPCYSFYSTHYPPRNQPISHYGLRTAILSEKDTTGGLRPAFVTSRGFLEYCTARANIYGLIRRGTSVSTTVGTTCHHPIIPPPTVRRQGPVHLLICVRLNTRPSI